MENAINSLKAKAIDFLQLASKGDARTAFQLYVGENFKHHNAYFKGDADTLMNAMDESAIKNPNKAFEIQRTLQDADIVAVHSRVEQPQGEIAVVHIFRFEGNKIVELWDIGMPVPKEKVNENGIF